MLIGHASQIAIDNHERRGESGPLTPQNQTLHAGGARRFRPIAPIVEGTPRFKTSTARPTHGKGYRDGKSAANVAKIVWR